MFQVVFDGNLTADARFSEGPERDAVNFTIAVNHGYYDKEENFVQSTDFYDCVRWVGKGKGKQTAESLTKGRGVQIEGELRAREPYTNEEKGLTYHNNQIIVDSITRRPKAGEAQGQGAAE